jgi:ribosomal protein L11 methyltransferase
VAWQEISIGVPYEYVDPISYLFSRYGRGLTMERDGKDRVVLRTYLPPASRHRLARIEIGVKLVSVIQPLGELNIKELPEDADWQNSWKSHFGLLRIGRRLVVRPSWIEYQAAPEEVIIEIDPGMAFGTGYHPTTYTCLEALEEVVQPGMEVLDLGTGSGILAIAAANLGAARVVALDIDPQAVRAARQNFRRAGITRSVALSLGSVPHPLAGLARFDVAVANISARGIRDRAPHVAPALRPGGIFIASGILKDQQDEVCHALLELGWPLAQEWPRDEWVTLGFRLEQP